MEVFFENLTYCTYGMTTMFTVFISILLYRQRGQNGLVRFLYRVMVFWSFILLKDIIYLAEGFGTDARIHRITAAVDMLCVPVFAVFLFEVVKPGWANAFKVSAMLLPTAVGIGIFVATDSAGVFRGLVLYSNIIAAGFAILVLRSVHNFNKYIKMNYSYTEQISIYWLRTVVVLLLLVLLLWSVVSFLDSQLGKSIYYLSLISVFTYIYVHTMRHHVVSMPNTLHLFTSGTDDNETPAAIPGSEQMAAKLAWSMDDRRMFLNPMLTLREVATAIGTNRTYLSAYLNQKLQTNFYDYVNAYRVKEAEKLLVTERNLKIEEIAKRCGFNSLSTFLRSFNKINGITPAKFRAKEVF